MQAKRGESAREFVTQAQLFFLSEQFLFIKLRRMNTKRLHSISSVAVSKSRWAAYATAGAATTLAGAGSAEADITYSGPLNQPFSNNQAAFSLTPNGSFQLGHLNPYFAGFYIGASVSAMFRGVAGGGNFRYPSRLGTGVNVSAGPFAANVAAVFATLASNYGGGDFGNFLAPGIGFIGFRFDGGSGIQYGWARVNMNGSANNNTFSLVDFAFADPGEQIATGQVPEPGTLGLLALGGVGLLVWRKRRAQAAA